MPVAPRIVNDVSYVTTINDAQHFLWQPQYLCGGRSSKSFSKSDCFVTVHGMFECQVSNHDVHVVRVCMPSLSLWTARVGSRFPMSV